MHNSATSVDAFHRPEAETCEYIGPEGVFWSKGPLILRSETIRGPVQPVASLRRPILQQVASLTRLGRRLARETFYNLVPLRDGSLFYTYGTECGFIGSDGEVRRLAGRIRPHRVLRGGVAVLPDDSIIFGEYFDNAERNSVRLYRARSDDLNVDEVFRFTSGEVRHVHSVRWDPFSHKAIVSAGDIGEECRIVAFTQDFSCHETLGSGSEDWRTISPQFSREAIYFGTDAQFAQNRILRYDRASGELSTLAEVNGPVFYSTALPSGWVFATSAELCPSQTSPEAILYHLDAETEAVTIIARFRKDRFPKRYFQFGILNFPITAGPAREIPVSGVALRGLDAKFVVLRDE